MKFRYLLKTGRWRSGAVIRCLHLKNIPLCYRRAAKYAKRSGQFYCAVYHNLMKFTAAAMLAILAQTIVFLRGFFRGFGT
jgi:hypothetical protein